MVHSKFILITEKSKIAEKLQILLIQILKSVMTKADITDINQFHLTSQLQ